MKKFGDMVGLVVKFQQGQPQTQLPMLVELGVKWVRDFVIWSAVEPVRHDPPRYEPFNAAFVHRLDYYKANDIGLCVLLTLENHAYENPWDPWFFGQFVKEITLRLKSHGVKFALEIGNEPNDTGIVAKFGGNWWGSSDRTANPKPAGWIDAYTHMCRGALEQVRHIDPTITVMTQDDIWLIQYWMLESGPGANMPALSVHPYCGIGPPEIAAPDPNNPDNRPFVVCDQDRSFASCVRRLREQGRKKLALSPQIWITEWGWAVDGVAHSVTDAMLSAYLPRAFILAYVAGVDVMCWFSSFDGPDGPMGLVRNNGTHRPSYDAFKRMVAELGDLTLVRAIASDIRGVNAYLFSGNQARKLVLWSVDAKPRSMTLSGSSISFAATPVYVSTAASDAEIDAAVKSAMLSAA